jgi:hypothetical protein
LLRPRRVRNTMLFSSWPSGHLAKLNFEFLIILFYQINQNLLTLA